MLLKSKEELNGAARILLNNLEEFYNDEIVNMSTVRSAQVALESPEWVHIYNLAQKLLFINNTQPHFGVLGEFEREAVLAAKYNGYDFRYQIIEDGIILTIYSPENQENIAALEIWNLDRSIRGLVLNMPSQA